MANIRSLKDFKDERKMRVYVSHLKQILKVLDLTSRGLKLFEVYTPVRSILTTIRMERVVLESHLKKFEKHLKEKNNE